MNSSFFIISTLLFISVVSHAETPAQTLYLLGYDIPIDERDSVVAEDVEAFREYQEKRIDSTYFNQFKGKAPKSKLTQFTMVNLRDLKLCELKDPNTCINDMAASTAPYEESMQTLAPLFADIDKLRQLEPQALTNIYPPDLQLPETPILNYQMLTLPIFTQSVLAYHNNANNRQGTTQICENIIFAKKLIQSKQNLIQSLIGKLMLDSHLDLLERTSAPLPASCVSALEPLSDDTISICPLIQAEARQTENLFRGIVGIPILFNRKATIKQVQKEAATYCESDWQRSVVADNVSIHPDIDIYDPWLFNKIGAVLLNIARPDYSNYQNRLQDSNAYLKLWQVAIDPQCSADSTRYIDTIQSDWHPNRQLHLDNKQRLTITPYQQENNNRQASTDNATQNKMRMHVSCRIIE